MNDADVHAILDYRARYGHLAGPGIGVIGAGFIVRDVQLPAYRSAGFPVVALASRTPEHARELAAAFDIPRCHDTWHELLADDAVEIVDIALPPDRQLEVIEEVVKYRGRIRGVLAQKPLALNVTDARRIVELCDEAGIVLAVNQNMRFDQSIRLLKSFLDEGRLGIPVLAQIVLNVRIDWQPYAEHYETKAMAIMSIHHLDAFRFLFGNPLSVTASTRPDEPPDARGTDQIATYFLEYASPMRAVGIDNCFAWGEKGITWRVDGTEGIASGTLGWPDHPWGKASTFDYVSRADPQVVYRPRWNERWFPDAFVGTMGQLLEAVDSGNEPEISGRDNLQTVELLAAAYRSAREHRAVVLDAPR